MSSQFTQRPPMFSASRGWMMTKCSAVQQWRAGTWKLIFCLSEDHRKEVALSPITTMVAAGQSQCGVVISRERPLRIMHKLTSKYETLMLKMWREWGRAGAWEDGFKVEASMQSLNCISGGIRNILKKNISPIFKISSPKSFSAILISLQLRVQEERW